MSNVDKAFNYLIGKTDQSRKTSVCWLPLFIHLSDTTGIMKKLISQWIPEATRKILGVNDAEIAKIACFIAYTHDIGKATYLFQNRMHIILPNISDEFSRISKIDFCNIENLKHQNKFFHYYAGESILHKYGCKRSIAQIVGAHHGKPEDMGDMVEDDLNYYPDNYYGVCSTNEECQRQNEFWESCWSIIIDNALKEADCIDLDDLSDVSETAQVIYSGLLVMADWLASNENYFPLIDSTSLNNINDNYLESRIENAWKKVGLSYPWNSCKFMVTNDYFKQEFMFEPNIVQQNVIDIVNNSSSIGLLIIESQMGSGKTEAALLASEVMAAKSNEGGIYFGLPTQATADGIFTRLESWAEKQATNGKLTIKLAHNGAEFNDTYTKLFKGVLPQPHGVENNEWFNAKKLSLLPNIVIGTIDQLLMIALKQKHLMLKHLGISGKVVIVDECHAYDAYMNEYLEMALEWLGAYNVPVILLSATLPYKKREKLIKAYIEFNHDKYTNQSSELALSKDYPLITWTSDFCVRQRKINLVEPGYKVKIDQIKENQLISTIDDKLSEGGCAGIIVNTVKKAQEIFELFEKEFPNKRIILIHSKFTMQDRAILEEEIIKHIGKSSKPEDRNNLIIIGTQVLEQSLDIDFDIIVTQLAPMDLLIQRIGRLHRHKRNRSSKLEKAQCLIIYDKEGEIDHGSLVVYDEYILLRTKERLKKENGIINIPNSISGLVQDVYDETIELISTTPKHIILKDKWKNKQGNQENNADVFRISAPKHVKKYNKSGLAGWLSNPVMNEQNAERSVRDTDESFEVLIMVKKADGIIAYLPWINGGRNVITDETPDEDECKEIARQRLRLPSILCRQNVIDQTISELEKTNERWLSSWKESQWLKGELVLLLDEKLEGKIGDFRISYSQVVGLTCKGEKSCQNQNIT